MPNSAILVHYFDRLGLLLRLHLLDQDHRANLLQHVIHLGEESKDLVVFEVAEHVAAVDEEELIVFEV